MEQRSNLRVPNSADTGQENDINMNSPVLALRVAATLFGLLCVAHIWRVMAGLRVLVGSYSISPLVSLIAAVITGALSLWMWRLAIRRVSSASDAKS